MAFIARGQNVVTNLQGSNRPNKLWSVPRQSVGALITGTVTTDEAGGILYALVDISALDPPAETVKSTGQHAQGVSNAGVQTVKIKAGAFGAGTWYIHYVQETAGFSNVITSPSFVIP